MGRVVYFELYRSIYKSKGKTYLLKAMMTRVKWETISIIELGMYEVK